MIYIRHALLETYKEEFEYNTRLYEYLDRLEDINISTKVSIHRLQSLLHSTRNELGKLKRERCS
jgi:outer membrane protein TolC